MSRVRSIYVSVFVHWLFISLKGFYHVGYFYWHGNPWLSVKDLEFLHTGGLPILGLYVTQMGGNVGVPSPTKTKVDWLFLIPH